MICSDNAIEPPPPMRRRLPRTGKRRSAHRPLPAMERPTGLCSGNRRSSELGSPEASVRTLENRETP